MNYYITYASITQVYKLYKVTQVYLYILPIEKVRLTARLKACYFPIYDSLKKVCEWLEDYGGNRHAFYCYRLEEYKDRLYNHYKETTKADFARLARLTKRDMTENILSILREGEAGNVNIV